MSRMSKNPGNKRPLNLDLTAPPAMKKLRAAQQILTSPDVQMLKLTSPELAEFLTRNPSLATPTPGGYAFPKTITEEQEMYAKGFEEALKNMHKGSDDHPGPTTLQVPPPPTTIALPTVPTVVVTSAADVSIAMIEKATSAAQRISQTQSNTSQQELSRPSSGASGSYDSEHSNSYILPDNVQIKEEEPDDDSNSTYSGRGGDGVVSPINMETQELIKLERKRMRNRVAASKCRKRKLERISQLDDRVKALKGENVELAAVVKKLKDSVCNLKQELMDHVNNGCQIVLSDSTAFS